ncbi:hypothetical protein LTR56_003072 [Elasticomyces elasticus]|nr:hypothetical protein LTR56_003072 [Elasticomyces elasticus]KAK3662134.1 hypothetical protein LTR22_007107 [Elasticomyces elasticus]KAK4927504.1 hypothetical protein LTR49_005644 [Elasticomyces elasticus]KAK5749758.1 hypothetical protein LTS12_020186 [Elasticomyces elasticus]
MSDHVSRDLEAQLEIGAIAATEKLSKIDAPVSLKDGASISRPSTPIRSQTNASAPDSQSARVTCRSTSDACNGSIRTSSVDEEEWNIINFVNSLVNEKPPADPWFLEMAWLRRLHFLHINKRLAACKKEVLEAKRATDEDMKEIKALLHDQADAIRDYQLIHSLDTLSPNKQKLRTAECMTFFPETGKSDFPDIKAFESANYRCVAQHSSNNETVDSVRTFLREYLPSSFTWTEEEKQAQKERLDENTYMPKQLARKAEILARFIVAMFGALFILVPMYIMALSTNRTKNLVTTTVAVLLFAIVCSLTLRASNDQTLGATAAYAAVLVVFVGLS